jgi:hypothetical protein
MSRISREEVTDEHGQLVGYVQPAEQDGSSEGVELFDANGNLIGEARSAYAGRRQLLNAHFIEQHYLSKNRPTRLLPHFGSIFRRR